jgi:predicted metal-dependent hydrolase
VAPELVARPVTVDFTGVRADWNAVHPEFGHLTNAMSTMLPHIEPFFIKSMRAAVKLLPEGPSELKRDIELFNYQEGRHHSNHSRFNQVIRAAYPEPVTEGEARLKRDYQRLWARGHRFALAYTEGFETVAPVLCDYFFRNAARYGLDTGEPAAYLWLWHVAEEHEHRTVANYVYAALYGDYRYRIYGILYATWHVFAYSLPLAERMMRPGLRRMRPLQRLRSRARYLRLLGSMFVTFTPHLLLRAFRPGYDPADLEPPAAALALLEEATARFGEAPRRAPRG